MAKEYDVFISYSRADAKNVERIARRLRDEEGLKVFFDKWELIAGEPWQEALEMALESSNVITVYIGSGGTTPWHNEEMRVALDMAVSKGKRVMAVLLPGARDEFVPPFLKRRTWVDFRPNIDDQDTFKYLVASIRGETVDQSQQVRTGQLFNVPQKPNHYLERPKEEQNIKNLLLNSKTERVGITGTGKVGLQGMGGIGKSVLAAVIAQDEEVRQAFPDGIIWLTISQTPNIVARQRQLAAAMGEASLAIDDPQHGKSMLGSLLANRKCLVILDDVWKLKHAEQFNFLGEDSCLLITTRNAEIIHSLNAQLHCLDLLEPDQALELLSDWSGQDRNKLPKEASQVAKECGYLPLALAMVGALVQHNPESWERALHRLQNADLDKLKRQFPDYPYEHLLGALEASILALPTDIRKKYESLAVFREDVKIPEQALQVFWQLDKYDVLDITDALVARSLIRKDENGTFSLHDLQSDYIRAQTNDLSELHKQLLAAYAPSGTPIPWYQLPQADPYIWENLIFHMMQAGQWQEIYDLLTNFDYMDSKCRATDVYDLEIDYRRAIRNWNGKEQDKDVLSKFEEGLRLESHRIAKAPEILFSTLFNHLSWLDAEESPVHNICIDAGRDKTDWFRSTQDPRPEPHLWNISFEGHTGIVYAVAVTPDGEQIVSGSRDETVKVWDLNSGRLLRSLEGHTDYVSAVAVTPDGEQVVSGSYDNTVKVWDLKSGRLLRSLEGHTSSVEAVAVTPDGEKIVSGSYDKTVKVWDLNSNKSKVAYWNDCAVLSLSLSSDGQWVIVGDVQGRVWIFEWMK